MRRGLFSLPIQLTVGSKCYKVDGVVFYIYINSTDVASDVDAVVIVPVPMESVVV